MQNITKKNKKRTVQTSTDTQFDTRGISLLLSNLSTIHDKVAKDAGLPDVVWCRECGLSQQIAPGYCLAHGWPKCCGATMTIDTPPHTEPGAGK